MPGAAGREGCAGGRRASGGGSHTAGACCENAPSKLDQLLARQHPSIHPPNAPLPPGLTKVPIDGQPKSIVGELENMARDYVKHENVIILAVRWPGPLGCNLAAEKWRGTAVRGARK